MAKEIVLAGACRTALGKFGGTLTNTPAVELGCNRDQGSHPPRGH